MLYPTHMLGGAVAAGGLASLVGEAAIPAMLAGAVGALAPDLDSRGSKGARMLPFFVVAVVVAALPRPWTAMLLAIVGTAALAASLLPWLLARTLGHRGPLHSLTVHLLAGLGAAATAALLGPSRWLVAALVAATVGSVAGGLALDACTVRGIPMLWPFRPGAVFLVPPSWRVRTGRRRELYVRSLLAALLCLLLTTGGAP